MRDVQKRQPKSQAVVLTMALLLSACAGNATGDKGANRDSAASSGAVAPTSTPTPIMDDKVLSVQLLSANIVPGQPQTASVVLVDMRYRITADAAFESAFGHANLPGGIRCAGGSVPIELGPLPNGAQVDREDKQLCSMEDAKSLAGETQSSSESLLWVPAKVTY